MLSRISRSFGIFLAVSMFLLNAWAGPPLAAETPHQGGTLRVGVAAEPPSLDAQQESTFATMIPMGTVYNTLLQFSPTEYPKIIGDLAKSWTIAPDGLTYTFTLHQGVKFHDGSDCTSADIKASFDKIISPPEGVLSPRKFTLEAVDNITTPDPHTVVFTLKHPSASLLATLASPWNIILAKKYLDKDPNYFKTNAMGTGPYVFKRYVRGSVLEVERNPHYWVKDRPYLDGVKFFFIKDSSARAKSLRAGQTDIEFRNTSPAEVEAMMAQKGDDLTVQKVGWVTWFGVAPNNSRPPLNDIRVRKALTLAIDRADMAKTLYPLTGLRDIGGLMRPGSPWGMSEEDLAKLPGFGKDITASRAEAKRLLAEAGYNDAKPLKVLLKTRNVKLPYIDLAVYVIASWQQIGVQVEHVIEETSTWFESLRNGDFDVIMSAASDYVDEPDIQLSRWVSNEPQNFWRYSNATYDELYQKQSHELDPEKRNAIVQEMQRLLFNDAAFTSHLWSARLVVHTSRLKNYFAHPSHYTNQRLQDIWLEK